MAVQQCPTGKLNAAVAEHLKKSGHFDDLPEWITDHKTAVFKEMSNYTNDWIFLRAAAVYRLLYLKNKHRKTHHKKLGVGTLSKYFGGRDRRHHSPAHFKRGTRKHLRYILKTFAKAGYVSNEEGENKFMIIGKGEQQLDLIAADLLRQMRNELAKKKEEEEEEDEDEEDVDLGEEDEDDVGEFD